MFRKSNIEKSLARAKQGIQPPVHWTILPKVVIVACLAGMGASLFYQISWNFSGLKQTGFLSNSNLILDTETATLIFAVMLASAISIFYLTLARLKRIGLYLRSALLAFVALFISASLYLNLVAISMIDGSGRLQYREIVANGSTQKMVLAARAMSEATKSHSQWLLNESEREAQGKRGHPSGYGTEYAKLLKRAENFEDTYKYSLGNPPHFPPSGGNAVEILASADANLARLKSYFEDFAFMAKKHGLKNIDTHAKAIAQIEAQIIAEKESHGGLVPTERTEVIGGVMGSLRGLLEWKASPAFVLQATIVLLPDLLSLFFALIIQATLAQGVSAEFMEHEHKRLTNELEIMAQVNTAMLKYIPEFKKHIDATRRLVMTEEVSASSLDATRDIFSTPRPDNDNMNRASRTVQ